ncbi:hypothetical protein GC176_21980 [bacterium]|nr:hypothetical protein [bacterium]
MKADQFHELYQDLQRYVGWTEDDARRVRSVAPVVAPHLGPLIEDFYAEIQRHPQTLKVIIGGEAQIARLKQTLRRWVEELLAAECDRDYVWRRWKIGWRHVEIGLPQVYTNSALSRLRTGLVRILSEHSGLGSEELTLTVESLGRLLDLDLAIIEDAYQAEYLARQERIRRLATIGELAGGVAHELRNPLGIIRNAVYFLRLTQQELTEDARDAFDELERALGTCNRLACELLDYVREPKLEETNFSIADAVTEALGTLEVSESIELDRETVEQGLRCRADRGHVVLIIGNLLRNAIEAMPSGGRVAVSASRAGDGVVVQVEDTGPGIDPTVLDKIFEPLFSRKAKGIGLGLAVSRRYAELNHGRLEVESEPGHGATFRLTLPSPEHGESGKGQS